MRDKDAALVRRLEGLCPHHPESCPCRDCKAAKAIRQLSADVEIAREIIEEFECRARAFLTRKEKENDGD